MAVNRCFAVSIPDCARPHPARSRIDASRVVAKDAQQRRDRVVGSQHRDPLDGPLGASRHPGSSGKAQQIVERAPRIDAAVSQQADDEERVRASFRLTFAARHDLVEVLGRLPDVVRREVELERRRPDAQVVRVQRRHEKPVERPSIVDLPAPAVDPRCDQRGRAVVVVDRALEQALGLVLRCERLNLAPPRVLR